MLGGQREVGLPWPIRLESLEFKSVVVSLVGLASSTRELLSLEGVSLLRLIIIVSLRPFVTPTIVLLVFPGVVIAASLSRLVVPILVLPVASSSAMAVVAFFIIIVALVPVPSSSASIPSGASASLTPASVVAPASASTSSSASAPASVDVVESVKVLLVHLISLLLGHPVLTLLQV